MQRNTYPGPVSKPPGRRLALLLVLVLALVALVGVLVFALFSGALQPQHPEATASPTAAIGPGGTLIPGTVAPSQTGPYGFTILKDFTSQTVFILKQLHVTWVRYQLDWNQIEPQPGQYNWATLDQVVSLLNANGLHIAFPLQKAPDWAKSFTCGGTPLLPGPTQMAQFATAVASRYNGHNGHGFIDTYEIGNEEFDNHLPPVRNIIDQSCPNIDLRPVAAADLKAGYQAVKTQSPHALVGMFAIWWVNAPHIQSYMQYLYQNGYGGYFDYANYHYYICGNNPAITVGDRPSFGAEWQLIHSIMAQHGDAGKPIWVTETGWSVNSNQHSANCVVTPQQQAQYMQYILSVSASSHVIQHLFWYTIDRKNDGDSIAETQVQGQAQPQVQSPMPSYYTLQRFIQQYPTWG
jgi:exo-beta-1,3-glucanase (GH17 family)